MYQCNSIYITTVIKFQQSGVLISEIRINSLNPELNPICYLLALLAHHFLHVSRIMVKSLTLRLLMSYIYIYIYDISCLRVNYQYHRAPKGHGNNSDRMFCAIVGICSFVRHSRQVPTCAGTCSLKFLMWGMEIGAPFHSKMPQL